MPYLIRSKKWAGFYYDGRGIVQNPTPADPIEPFPTLEASEAACTGRNEGHWPGRDFEPIDLDEVEMKMTFMVPNKWVGEILDTVRAKLKELGG